MPLNPVAKHSFGVALALALGFCCGRAAAQTRTWDANGANPPDGIFSVANNWNPNFVPSAGNTALFDISDTYNVTFTASVASDSVEVTAGTVSFLSDSAAARTYNLVTGAADLAVRGSTLNVGAVGAPIDLNVGDRLLISDTPVDGTVIVAGHRLAVGRHRHHAAYPRPQLRDRYVNIPIFCAGDDQCDAQCRSLG